MSSKVAVLAAALALSSPVFADKPSKSTQTVAKAPASKTVPNRTPQTSTNLGGTAHSGTAANGGIIAGVQMMMLKDAKNNNADQKKEAQAARGSTSKGAKFPGNLTVIPPKK
jgi:hypothetical protein